jgi:hypothetical protein
MILLWVEFAQYFLQIETILQYKPNTIYILPLKLNVLTRMIVLDYYFSESFEGHMGGGRF